MGVKARVPEDVTIGLIPMAMESPHLVHLYATPHVFDTPEHGCSQNVATALDCHPEKASVQEQMTGVSRNETSSRYFYHA